MEVTTLQRFFERGPEVASQETAARVHVDSLLEALESGRVRAAEPAPSGGGWRVHAWVKQGILTAFRLGVLVPYDNLGSQGAFDKDTLPLRRLTLEDGVRLVPGGTAIRRGAYVARGVTLMPPAYVNVGAFVDTGTMVDSHALVGSCAQVGKSVHLSAGAQIGGVLEPVGALPVVVEDEVFVGALSGVFEGVRVGRGALIAAGVMLTSSTPIADLVNESWIRADGNGVLSVPPGAVIVPGARPARGSFAADHGIQLQTPVLIRYRQGGGKEPIRLEEALR